MTALSIFCNQLIAFFEDLKETYPEEKDIAQGVQSLRFLKQTNPRMMHKLFMEHVHNKYAQRILDEDEDYIIQAVQVDAKGAEALWIFKKHWATMSETNRQHIWRYIKTLILLARRV